MINKNIKFFNFEDDTNIKISGHHIFEKDYSEYLNKRKSMYSSKDFLGTNYNADYVVTTIEDFETDIKQLYDKLYKLYFIDSEDRAVISVGTIDDTVQVAKSQDVLKLPFKSYKNIFIDANQFVCDIDSTNLTGSKFINNKQQRSMAINCMAYARTSSKEILEFIVLFTYITIGEVKLELKIRRHLGIKDNKNLIHPEMYSIEFNYKVETEIVNIFEEPFGIIQNSIYNVIKFLDYEKREKTNKDLKQNIPNLILYPDIDKITYIKSVSIYNDYIQDYLKHLDESLIDFNEYEDKIKSDFENISSSIQSRDTYLIAVNSQNTDYLKNLKLGQISFIFTPTGVSKNIITNQNKNGFKTYKYTIVMSNFITVKLHNDSEIPVDYYTSISFNLDEKIIEIRTDVEHPDLLVDIGLIPRNFSINTVKIRRFINPLLYVSENEANIDIIRYEFNSVIINQIKELLKDTTEDDDRLIEKLYPLLFNKDVKNSLLCDIFFLSDQCNI